MTKQRLLGALGFGVVAAGVLANHLSTERRVKELEQRYRVVAETLAEQSGDSASKPAPVVLAASALAAAMQQGPTPEPPAVAAAAPNNAPATPTLGEQIGRLESVFVREPADARWAHESERTLADALRAHGGESRLDMLECRTDLCKAQVVHKDDSGMQQFLASLVGPTRFWAGAIASLRDESAPEGVIKSVVFFGKDAQMPFPN